MKTITLTITEPRKLAEAIKANESNTIWMIAEGTLMVAKTVQGTRVISFDGTPDGDDAVNAYANALAYELERLGIEQVVFAR